jgi:predicted nuclease with TOPRIM domain
LVAEDKLEDFSKRIADIETKLALLGNSSGNEGSSGADLNTLNDLLKSYMKKSDLDAVLKRLEKCEKDSGEAKEGSSKCLNKVHKWKPKWKQIERDIEELKKQLGNKLDCALFDEEMDKMKNLINSLAGKELKTPVIASGPSISSKELNNLREAIKKIQEHEEKINKLQSDLKGINIESIIKRLNSLAEEVKTKADKTDIFKLESEKADKITVESEFKRVWRELEQLKTWVSNLDNEVKALAKMNQANSSSE